MCQWRQQWRVFGSLHILLTACQIQRSEITRPELTGNPFYRLPLLLLHSRIAKLSCLLFMTIIIELFTLVICPLH